MKVDPVVKKRWLCSIVARIEQRRKSPPWEGERAFLSGNCEAGYYVLHRGSFLQHCHICLMAFGEDLRGLFQHGILCFLHARGGHVDAASLHGRAVSHNDWPCAVLDISLAARKGRLCLLTELERLGVCHLGHKWDLTQHDDLL